MNTNKTIKKKTPTPVRETDELAQLLDIAEKITGKSRSEIYRDCVLAELPKYIRRESPAALRKAEDAAESLRRLLEDFERIAQGKK